MNEHDPYAGDDAWDDVSEMSEAPEPGPLREIEEPEPPAPPEPVTESVYVPLVDTHVDGEPRKVEVYRLRSGRDAKGRRLMRETPIMLVPAHFTQHDLMNHEAIRPGRYRVRLRNPKGEFGPFRDYDWRDDDEEPEDDGVELIGRGHRRIEPPDSPRPSPAPGPNVLDVLARAREEREAALAQLARIYEARLASAADAAEARMKADAQIATDRIAQLEARLQKLDGERSRLNGELKKAERALNDERFERLRAETRLEMRPATASTPAPSPSDQATLAALVQQYKRQAAEFEAVQAELGVLATRDNAAEAPADEQVDVATMMPRVMQHMSQMGDLFDQFERFSDKFKAFL